ncbi:hypothetical protein BAUCODRAFT_71826 [Baudoinia panamericana UAMH 10762]|uniref:Uncharacterized protein n=1 Tax=Baudoinia panamericana (strain UAMH 10762) TaxID=717646 RepID=M2NA76_BAUPA|nr:uncharacterized protein BAUCODRAFT_71826 [Baudoinia panamericana UAMH 10762]EMC96024.1 hypothetical protein BAUCODRAFT_71826 [Baudoinia panamericana UAMH 10762]
MLFAAAGCTIATTVITLSLITLHLRRYRAPKEQRQIIRITFSVILYAVVAFFEVYDYRVAEYIDPVGDLYEAFGLCALYLLFIEYAAPFGTYNDELFVAVKEAEEVRSVYDWPRICWIFVFQYPICETICFAIILSTEATGGYCTNSLEPQFAHLWVEILQSVGIGACVIAILAFRNRMKQLMKCRRALAKILCFKVIVFIRFTQAWVFSLLLQYKVVTTGDSFSYNDILWGIPGLATCAEMVLFATGFWYAFSSTEYGSSAKPQDRPLPLRKAVLDALNPTDLIVGIYRIFPLVFEVHRNGDWRNWRIASREEGMHGAVRRGVRKLKNRKGGSQSGFHELDESLEELKLPTQSYYARSESPAAGIATVSHITGEARTPNAYPEEARSYLIVQTGGDRSTSPSQVRWNGQGYERTPSSGATVVFPASR